MTEVVSVILALVAPDDVEKVVLGQELVGHVRAEQAAEASRIRFSPTFRL